METKPKVLYVDDEKINLLLFKVNFEDQYEVFTAVDGFNGLSILDENPEIVIVFSDMKMPGMNGLEFINGAKEKYPNKKYYILTGFDITDEIKEAIESGLIIEYFRKPFEVEKMHGIMSEAVKDHLIGTN